MTSPARKLLLHLVFSFGAICLLFAVAWAVFFRELKPTALPVPDLLPATDIIFQSGIELGFINADGSGLTTARFVSPHTDFASAWGRPMVAGGDAALIVTIAQYPGLMGNVLLARRGEVAMDCGWYGIARLSANGHHILLETLEGQEKYRPEDCGTENPPEKAYSGVVGALSPDEKHSAEVDRGEYGAYTAPHIIVRNLNTDQQRTLGEGDFPVWSRDSEWLAYTGPDGIYIVQNGPTLEPRQLVSLEGPEPGLSIPIPVYEYYPPDQYYPPIASWSPDGEWLVYHAYLGLDGQFSIFKVNAETGETIGLVEDGLSPFWRWPLESE